MAKVRRVTPEQRDWQVAGIRAVRNRKARAPATLDAPENERKDAQRHDHQREEPRRYLHRSTHSRVLSSTTMAQ